MIYLTLFLTFLEIGAVSFGGGYGMISLMREKALAFGWMTEEELLNVIAIAESTPGPIAVNMATFVGSRQGGVLGALLSTLGVILPSFIIILLIAALIKNFLKYTGVKAFLSGVRPCVVGLILSTAITMGLSKLFGLVSATSSIAFDVCGTIIFFLLIAISLVWSKIKKKKPSPILMIMISALLGVVLYPLF